MTVTEGAPKPLVSVVMVCRNASGTIEAALASVAARTWPDWELVVVDGASSDETPRILERWRDRLGSRMDWRSESDAGIFDAMNKGLRRARGEWVHFLNADDVYAGDLSEVRSTLVAAEATVSAVYGTVRFVDRRHGFSEIVRGAHRKVDFAFSRAPHHQGIFLRRSSALAAGGFDLSLGSAADLGLIAALRARGGSDGFRRVEAVVTDFALGGVSERPDALALRERERARAVGRHLGLWWGLLNFAHGATLWLRSWSRVALDRAGCLAAWRRVKSRLFPRRFKVEGAP